MSTAKLIRIDPEQGTILDEETILQPIDIPILPEQILYDGDNNRYFSYVFEDRIYIEKRSNTNQIQWTISNENFTGYTLTEQDIERTPSLALDFYNYLNLAFSVIKSGITYVGIAKISRSGQYISLYEELVTNENLDNPIRPIIRTQPENDRTLMSFGKKTSEGIEKTVKVIGTTDQTTGKQLTQEIKILPSKSGDIANISLNTISEEQSDKQIRIINKSEPIVLNRKPFANFKGVNYLKITNGGVSSDDINLEGKITTQTNTTLRTSFKTNTARGSSQFNKENTVFDENGNIIHTFEYKDLNSRSNIGLVKLNKNGFKLWESNASILTRSNNEYFPKLAKDPLGNVILIFSTDSVTRGIPFKNGFDIVIAKFSSTTGTIIWSIRSASINTDNNDIIPAINVDNDGNIIIAVLNDGGKFKIIKLFIDDTEQLRDTLTIQLSELTTESQNILNDITLISEKITVLGTELSSGPSEERKQEINTEIQTYQTQITNLQFRINILGNQINEINTILDSITR
jgi:hypothetical protein